jgi:hypothetical protein
VRITRPVLDGQGNATNSERLLAEMMTVLPTNQ